MIDDGYLLIAGNYDYQGKCSGEWQSEVKTLRDFKRNGWTELKKSVGGGTLVQADYRRQLIFTRARVTSCVTTNMSHLTSSFCTGGLR